MQTALDFGCRRASPKPAQHSDYNGISGAERALFEGENAFFRCRQRNQGRAALAILSSAFCRSHTKVTACPPARRLVRLGLLVAAGIALVAFGGHRYLTFAAPAENRDWLCGLIQQWGFVTAFLYIAVYADPGLKSPFSLFFDP